MLRPVCLALYGFAAAATAQELLTPELLWQLRRVGEPALSPDGRRIAFTVRSIDLAADKGTTQIFLLDLATGAAPRQLTQDGSNSGPMWSKDGSELAFVSSQKDGAQIWVQRLGQDGARQVTTQPGGVANAQWSPDGSRFLFTADVKIERDLHDQYPDLPKANARAYDNLMVRHWDQWRDGSYSHLFVVPAAGGAARDLMAGDAADTPMKPFGGSEQICWSADSQQIVYTCVRVKDPATSTDSSVWRVAIGGGAAENLTPGMPGYDQDPACSPDGRYVAFASMARGGCESDRLRLFLHDNQSRQNRELLTGFDASVHELHWTADAQQLLFTVETEGTTQLYRAAIADGKAVPVTKGRHHLDALQPSADGKTVYALRSTMERPAELVKIELQQGGAGEPLTDINGDQFAHLRPPTVRSEWFEASDGKKIQAFVVLPPGFDEHRKYPMLLFCQGGPQVMVGQAFSFRWNFHLMAARGYVVAAVNRRGLPGFGQAWTDQISRDWGGQCMRDLLSVTDAMQSRPYVDREHCGAVGASFGGYTVYWLMGNAGDRFACMVSHCGVFNLESMYLATEELWFVNWDLGGPFWQSPEIKRDYDRFSPHRFVQNWKTPLLVIEGEKDFRVPYDQGLQAFTAAQLRAVPSRLLEFPDEGHWVLHPQNGVLWQREFFSWLDRWCKEVKK
ncbi:MAG TPA: S9 family peptidase [Planctomycetota bacterium]|nr:S9 family peptidase [Planctomycetota bacterium]